MTYENIKSLILVILVGFSVLLTWSIWTYQPNYEIMGKPKTVQEVAVSDKKKDAKEIVKPDRIYYHFEKNNHYGTIDKGEIGKIMTEISRWNFSDFVDVSGQIKSMSNFIHNSGNAVIQFPDSIPFEYFRTISNMKEKKNPDFSFDRIIIDLEGVQKEHGYVYFASTENKEVFRSFVPASFVHNFENSFVKNAEHSVKYAKYFPYKTGNDLILFLPVDETEMVRYQYLSSPLDSEKFMNALFNNPSVVQKNYPASEEEEYTNGSSLMRVNQDKGTLSYINTAGNNESSFTSNNLLKRSIDFVNEHGGWTDDYQFVSMDELNHQVLFRQYIDGYPVFSEGSGISEISQTWGQNEINKYSRSNFSSGHRMDLDETVTTLSSGEEVIQILESQGHNMDRVEDIMLGYTMEKSANILYLEPSWYYRYNHSWKKLTMNDVEGGLNRGLE